MKKNKKALLACLLLSSFNLAAQVAPLTYKLSMGTWQIEQITSAIDNKERTEVVDRLLEQYIFDAQFNFQILEEIANILGIYLMDDFKALPRADQHKYLAEVVKQYTKMSGKVIKQIRKNKHGLDLVTEAITNHPHFEYLRGVIPRGHKKPWDTVVGAGAGPGHHAVIAGDRMGKQYHGSVSVVLHEVGHGVDRYFKDRYVDWDFSGSRDFKTLQKNTPFAELFVFNLDYYKDYKEENFAEIFAKYFDSPESRKKLEKIYPEAFKYMAKNF